MINNGTVYGNAFFEVNYVRVYGVNSTGPSSSSTSSPSSTSAATAALLGKGVWRARVECLFVVLVGLVLWA